MSNSFTLSSLIIYAYDEWQLSHSEQDPYMLNKLNTSNSRGSHLPLVYAHIDWGATYLCLYQHGLGCPLPLFVSTWTVVTLPLFISTWTVVPPTFVCINMDYGAPYLCLYQHGLWCPLPLLISIWTVVSPTFVCINIDWGAPYLCLYQHGLGGPYVCLYQHGLRCTLPLIIPAWTLVALPPVYIPTWMGW